PSVICTVVFLFPPGNPNIHSLRLWRGIGTKYLHSTACRAHAGLIPSKRPVSLERPNRDAKSTNQTHHARNNSDPAPKTPDGCRSARHRVRQLVRPKRDRGFRCPGETA